MVTHSGHVVLRCTYREHMSLIRAGTQWRQLNVGYVPVPVIRGLDLLAEANDLSRAQLARRVLSGYVASQLLAVGAQELAGDVSSSVAEPEMS